MRALVFFDLPRNTSKETSAAARFVKDLRKEGFLMLQESVYCKLLLNLTAFDSVHNYLEKIKPQKGNIMLLTVTEKQFNDMELLIGQRDYTVCDKTERVVVV